MFNNVLILAMESHALPTELAGHMLQQCINSDIISVTTIDKGFALCRPAFFHLLMNNNG
jgi:hypothetical protein